jgi:hypothetical protein
MEHNIRTWAKSNGSWDVTLHSSGRTDGYLHDVAEKFRNFKTREDAERYALKLFLARMKPKNFVELGSPDSFGQETLSHSWSTFDGKSWLVKWDKGKLFYWSSPANANDKSNVPKFVLDALLSISSKPQNEVTEQ